jgi:exoribonuclease R
MVVPYNNTSYLCIILMLTIVMNNALYEETYSRVVEPIYGEKRDIDTDEELGGDIGLHDLSVTTRVDMTKYETYSIDPPGCTDADDAFSIYFENDKMYMAIHIADPTEYIPLQSNLWRDIYKRITTKYPSNRPPIHMMHHNVLSLSSLQGDEHGCVKKAITVVSEIDVETYQAINGIKLLFTQIYVKRENAYTYQEASNDLERNEVFMHGIKISKVLKAKRTTLTKGAKLSDVNASYMVYDKDYVYLTTDSEGKKQMKEMIGEFAIFANSFVGEYLKIHLNTGIFRCCNASNWLKNVYDDISGPELLHEIIMNGIKAEYLSHITPHDLVGMPEYCHFTSPIRRLADCVCHYLLKYIHQKNDTPINAPFTENELETLASLCLTATKKEKKHQYLDTKFRLLQVMHNMLLRGENLCLMYYITGYSGLFLNIIINRINHFNVHMSYTLRVRSYNKPIDPKLVFSVNITCVNCFTKFDENTLPELDAQVLYT